MITVEYRLIGEIGGLGTLTKSFETDAEFQAWRQAQVNVMILSIETSGKAVASKLNSLFGC